LRIDCSFSICWGEIGMSVAIQFTPYGLYDIKYFGKKHSERSSGALEPAPSIARIYGKAAANFILGENFFSQGASIPKNEYKKQIFSLLHAAGNLSEQAEAFVEEEWPKLAVDAGGLGLGRASASAAEKDYFAQVSELAADYSFATEPVWGGRQDIAEAGAYSVAVEKGGNVEKAIFYVDGEDTALAVLNKLAGSLNSFSQTARAFVLKENGYARLEVVAAASGAAGAFALHDDQGDILSRLNASLATKGQDFRGTVDGREYVQPSNRLLLDGGKLELDFVRTGQARISVAPDNGLSMKSLKDLVQSYNAFESVFLRMENRTERADEMFEAFSQLFADSWGKSAGRLGVRQDGYELLLDEDAGMDSLKKSPRLIAALGEKGVGLAFILRNMARGIQRNPLSIYFSVSYGDAGKSHGLMVDLSA
jgi:hypothetical protein